MLTKLLFALLALLTPAFATQVGDTYDQVIAERGKPKSQLTAGLTQILNYPDASVKIKDNRVISMKLVGAPASVAPGSKSSFPTLEEMEATIAEARTPEEKMTILTAQRTRAVDRVKAIVNQPVRSLPRSAVEEFSNYREGWFHAGALTPDFNNVDIRKTQKLAYKDSPYVSSYLNPNVVFVGPELEFNPMTKYFYVDRTVPKKKLTEAEMIEINQLYRIIGKCDSMLSALKGTK